MATSATELREMAEIFALHEERLDQGDAKFHEHDRALAELHQENDTLRNEILILRDAVSAHHHRMLDAFDQALRNVGAKPVKRPGPNGETPRR